MQGPGTAGSIPDLGETESCCGSHCRCGVELREGRRGLGTGHCIPAYPVWSPADHCICAEFDSEQGAGQERFCPISDPGAYVRMLFFAPKYMQVF